MRISDWSSDVCSSDLFTNDAFDLQLVEETVTAMGLVPKPAPHLLARYGYLAGKDDARAADINAMYADDSVRAVFAVRGGWGCARILPRSEEHTSELQSLMRISYAVFCLKKQKNKKQQ